jgi:hypothetical protein
MEINVCNILEALLGNLIPKSKKSNDEGRENIAVLAIITSI